MNARRHILLSLFLIAIILTVGCGENNIIDGETEKTEELSTDYTPIEGGEVILPLTNFKTLNPLITDNYYYFQFSKLIFEGLFDFNESLEPVPILTESYDILNEGKTIAIKIKDNIQWHDGKVFSTYDVAFTIDVIKYANETSVYNEVFHNALNGLGVTNLNDIVNYRIIDDKNIEINYDKAYSNSLEVLTFPIIPKHLFHGGTGTTPYAKALEESNYTPIGTGPYKFISYEKYKNISLKANESYWNGKPYIEDVIGRVFEDEELILTAFETGQISFAPTIGIDWDKYKQNNRIKVLEYISSNYEFIGFNFNNPLFQGEKGLAIRQAINYGINRQAIIQKVFLGHGTQIDVPIHPDSYLMSSEGYAYGYDLDRAKQLLNDAGFKGLNNDGILIDEEGNVLSLRFITNSFNPYRLRIAELIIEDLKELGINIIVDFKSDYKDDMGDGEINEEWEKFNLKVQSGDYDMVLLGWETSAITDLSSMFHSSNISEGSNFIKYNNEVMDELLLDTYFGIAGKSKIDAYKEVQKFIIKELPYVSLFYNNRGLLIDTKIIGDLDPRFYNLYNGLEDCFIPKNLQ